MSRSNREAIIRSLLVLAILLFGVAMVPFVDWPLKAIGWKMFAGVYSPVLDINAPTGAPSSYFTFTGNGYPPNATATVYVNAESKGTVTTDASGLAEFAICTVGAPPGQYSVTMEVNINASATQSFELVKNGDSVPLPPGFTGSILCATYGLLFPVVAR